MRPFLWWLTYAVGVAVAAQLLDGVYFDYLDDPVHGLAEIKEKTVPLLGVSLVLSLVATLVAPIMKLASRPLMIVTLGFLLLVINTLMFLLVGSLGDTFGFYVDGFWNALVGTLIVAVIGWGVRTALPMKE